MDAATLAPLPEKAKQAIRKALKNPHATEGEIQAYAERSCCEWRAIPRKLDVAHSFAVEAEEIVDELMREGITFPKGKSAAAETIAATLYAAWYGSESGVWPADPMETGQHIAMAMTHALRHALAYGEGMPRMHRETFADALAKSTDPIDRVPIMQSLEAVWPKQFPGGRISGLTTSGEPQAWITHDDDEPYDEPYDESLENTPSIFTDLPEGGVV